MEYIFLKEGNVPIGNVLFVKDDSEVENSAFDYIYNRIPYWLLTALLSVLPWADIEKEIHFDDTHVYRVKAYIEMDMLEIDMIIP